MWGERPWVSGKFTETSRAIFLFAACSSQLFLFSWASAPERFSFEKGVATCRPQTGSVDTSIALTASQPEVLFKCEDGSPVPLGLADPGDRQVCEIDLGLSDCNRWSFPIGAYLPGATNEWFTGTDLKSGIRFSVPDEEYPASLGGFRIGCLSGRNSCLVNVFVEPREADVRGQVARCAYGSPTTLRSSLTPENNQITVVCTREGNLLPVNFATEYCDVSAQSVQCVPRPFSNVFPSFDSGWWERTASKTGVTLKIPSNAFPKEKKSFSLVCRNAIGEPNDCRVHVDVAGVDLESRLVNPGGGDPGQSGSGSGSQGAFREQQRQQQEVPGDKQKNQGPSQKSRGHGIFVQGSVVVIAFVTASAVSSLLA